MIPNKLLEIADIVIDMIAADPDAHAALPVSDTALEMPAFPIIAVRRTDKITRVQVVAAWVPRMGLQVCAQVMES